MSDKTKDKKQAQAAAGGIISAEGEGAAEANFDPGKDLAIHSMPKRFLKLAGDPKKTKGIGVFILAIGAVFLIAALVFMYYYLTEKKSEDISVITPIEKPAEVKETEKEKPLVKKPTVNENKDQASSTEEKNISSKASSAEAEKTASSTKKTATGTAKVIQIPEQKEQKEYSAGIDSDKDGLTDVEEILFDCNINSVDSDGDGYNDLSEILNLYNPAGGGSLMVNPNIEKYISSQYGYYLYYPYVWRVDDSSGAESIIFKIENNQFIEVIVQANTDKQLLEDWYLKQMEIDKINNDRRIYKKGWQAIKSEDNLTVYLAKPGSDKIFIISYNPGLSNTLSYKNVFDMMVKSFEAD